MKFLNEKNITLKNFFTRSSANEVYACEDNKERENARRIATLLESPVKIYCRWCGKFPRNTQRAIDHLHIYHEVEKISNQQDVSLWVAPNFHLYAVLNGIADCTELGEFHFEHFEVRAHSFRYFLYRWFRISSLILVLTIFMYLFDPKYLHFQT